MSPPSVRIFVPAGSCDGGRLQLAGAEAARVSARGVRAGDAIEVLDDSGWVLDVIVELCAVTDCTGRVAGRHLATERRTKVSLHQGLLHPADFRRLLAQATRLGVVAFGPTVTDQSTLPLLGPQGLPADEAGWPELVREAAEESGRGRRPVLRTAMLFDHAMDAALGAGAVLLADPAGGALGDALADRPFSIDLFCPPPSGFSREERQRARARGCRVVRPPQAGPDPILPALSVLEAVYALLERVPAQGGDP
jgi:16S rRNA (uracil1498-N3)-methyltransferase